MPSPPDWRTGPSAGLWTTARKFVEREIRRGRRYDAIIMDPPSYGRGPSGEIWKLEENLYPFVQLVSQVLSDKPLFVIINSYTTGLAPSVVGYIMDTIFTKRFGGDSECGRAGPSGDGFRPGPALRQHRPVDEERDNERSNSGPRPALYLSGREERAEHVVFDDLNLDIEAGKLRRRFGHNGCGKSTLAKHLNAILLPEGGSVTVYGMDTKDEELLLAIRQPVGMVFQNPDNQIVSNVVEEDVAFAPENLGVADGGNPPARG